jgi:hypothetical protein
LVIWSFPGAAIAQSITGGPDDQMTKYTPRTSAALLFQA